MKSFAVAIALAALLPNTLGLTVNTPVNVVQCQPIQFTWTSGTPPYFLSLIPGGQTAAPPIKQFPPQQGTSFTWLADLQANTIFNIVLKDNTGTQVFSDIVTITAGGDSSCLNTAVSENGSGSAAPTSTSPASGSSASTTGASGSASKSGSAATPTKSGNTANRFASAGAFGVAGVMGLVGAALF
jgi:hypothetical protein